MNQIRRQSIIKLVFVIFLAIYLPFQGLAWGLIGHRVIGEIAFLNLSPKAKKEITRILGTESLAMSGNWADFVKSDPSYDYLYNWHFININESLNYEQFIEKLKRDTAVDAYTKLNLIIDSLKNKNLPIDKKQMYLKLLVHITGDIHQPLHVGRLSDLGGNRVRVQWFNQNSNLHRVWDEQLIEFQQLSYTEYATNLNYVTKAQRQSWQTQTLADWVFESYQLAQKIYGGVTEDNQKLSYKYNYDYLETVNSQLQKAGIRLAGILNEIYG